MRIAAIARDIPKPEHTESRTMSFGTVRWFNRKIGAGFIRTDEGEDVSFINSAVQESQLYSICKDRALGPCNLGR